MLAIPGLTVMLVGSYALEWGKHTGWATVPGVPVDDFTAITFLSLEAGAVLAASATLITILKLVGAAYLIWLGIRLLWAKPKLVGAEEETSSGTGWSMFWNAYVVAALKPKGIVFFGCLCPASCCFEQIGVAAVCSVGDHVSYAGGYQRRYLGSFGRAIARNVSSTINACGSK